MDVLMTKKKNKTKQNKTEKQKQEHGQYQSNRSNCILEVVNPFFFFLKVFTKYITELKGTIVAQKYSEIWTNKTIASSAKFTLKPHFINF